jgi:hypothetical protein
MFMLKRFHIVIANPMHLISGNMLGVSPWSGAKDYTNTAPVNSDT